MSGYNGWSNYETWRINLEVLDGMTPEDFGFDVRGMDDEAYSDTERLAEALEAYSAEVVLGSIPEGLAYNLAAHFLNRVDWVEIAEQLVADAKEEN